MDVTISMIAAMAKNRVIGKDNQMPWHLPADLKHFKANTLGKAVIMGRKTYESIGRALPGRPNIVVTRDMAYQLADATVVHSCEQALEQALSLSKNIAQKEVMIIGGGTVYEHFLPYATRLYLTHIELETDGDTQFPDYANAGDWQVKDVQKCSADDNNPYHYRFETLELAK